MRNLRTMAAAVLAGALTVAVVVPAAAAESKAGTTSLSSTTTLRAFHNSPDTGKVEILVNGGATGITLSYPDLTDYISLPVGAEVTVRIIEGAGTGAELNVTVPASGRPLTVAAIGSLAALVDTSTANDGSALRLKAFTDRSGASNYIGQLRVAHTSPDAPPVDVQVRLLGRWVTVIRGLSFGNASAYLPLPRKNPINGKLISYSFRVRIAGTTDVVTSVTTPLPHRAQTVYAIGFAAKLGSGTPDAFGLKITRDGVK